MRLLPPAIAAGLVLGLRTPLALGACAPVTSANDLCAQNANPCVIDGKECPVVPGTTLDFGARAVVLQHGTRLDVGAGILTVVAGSLELQAGTGILGHGGAVIVHTQGSIAVLRSGATRARIDVADPAAANRIELSAANGTIQIDGYLDARGTNTDGVGGSVELTGGSILVAGDILTSGGNVGLGGPISVVSSDSILMSGTVDGSGGTGGSLDLEADGSITTTNKIDIRATGAGGDGGVMTVLTTTGAVTLGGKIYMQGDEGTDADGGASGGEIDVFSAASLLLAADFEISGAPPDGQGGDAYFMAMLDTVQTGLIQAQGRGSQSAGGSVEFDAQRSLTLGPIDLHGGDALPDSGGGLDATSWCDLTVPLGVTITAEGDKGENLLHSGGQLAVQGALKAGGRN
ncbi:MAG: hypothetical protein ACREQL_05240, partial [Candidatus Binatia bacterium]